MKSGYVTILIAIAILCISAGSASQPAKSAAQEIKEGDAHINEEHLNLALTSYMSAVLAEPGNALARERLGHTYSLLHRLPQAAAELNYAIHIDPRFVPAHVELGRVYGMQGAFPASIVEERTALSLDPKNVTAYLNLGVALAHTQEYGESATAFEHALALDPNNLNGLTNLAAVSARQMDYGHAIQMYKRVLKLDPNNANAHIGLGTALGKVGDLQGQIRELRAAIKLDSKNASAHGQLGWALYRAGEWNNALTEGVAANELRMQRGSSTFIGTLIIGWAALFLVFGIVFGALFMGSNFKPQSNETVLNSFFLVFYKDKPGRFIVTTRRLVFVPEAFSQWFGATRLSFEHVDVETFHGTKTLQGARLSILCTNGSVYHFAMPSLVLEPVLSELKKLKFGSVDQVEFTQKAEIRASQTNLPIIPPNESVSRGVDDESDIVTVVHLPEIISERKLED
jgi:tetratricopeptide (TPR) repeat protein